MKLVKLVISRRAWQQLADYHAESMGVEAAQRFMDAHFIKAEPIPTSEQPGT